jgi:TetR/AcrR family transcriptional regulator
LNGRSKQLRSDRRRTQILASASDVFRRLGVHGAGMRQIADAAGISAGSLYYYFRNKEELIYFCQDRTLDALLDVAKRARGRYGAMHQLEFLIRGHLQALLGDQASGVVHLEFGDLPPAAHKKILAKRDRYERAVRALISAGQARGQLHKGDPKLATFALLGALNWTARWFRAGGGFAVEVVADSFCQQLLGGILAHGRGDA